MKRSTKTIAALVTAPLTMLIAATSIAAADPDRPNYKYVELDYVYGSAEVTSDGFSDELNNDSFYVPEGLALKGSYVFVEQILLRGSYYAGKGEWKKTADVDVSSGVASIGWLAPTTDATGIDVSLDYRKDNIELKRKSTGAKGDSDIAGAGISFGVRAAPTKRTEIGARVGWYEGDFKGAIGFALNAAWNINDRWGINASYDSIDADVNNSEINKYELNQFALGGRFYF